MQENRLLTTEELFGITGIPISLVNIKPNLANKHFLNPSLWYKTGKFLEKYGIWVFIGGVIITAVAVNENNKRKAAKALSGRTPNSYNLEKSIGDKKTNINNPEIVRKSEEVIKNHEEKATAQSSSIIRRDYNIL